MERFYIYDCWARDRGRVHRGDCPNCNHGSGMMPTPSSQHGAWHGPFQTRAAAFAFATSLQRADMLACGRCKP